MEQNMLKYEIRLITEEYENDVLDHLQKFFFRTEPLNEYINLLEFEDSRCVELENFCKKCIPDKNSVMAITPSGEIIGVCLNGKFSLEDDNKEDECKNVKFAKILRLLDYCNKTAAPFVDKLFPGPNKIIMVKVLSTDTKWRGRGIAGELMDRSRKIAYQQGYNLMRVDCSSHFSARAISKLGFECVYELKYEDYKENGEVVFKPSYPHTCVAVYAQRITAD